jgi:DNA-directed RNA polymerase subunit beta'
MSISGPLGSVLVNSLLPEVHRISGPLDKKNLRTSLKEYARKDPRGYAEKVTDIKNLGDEFATYEGVSVGLDDIEPQYRVRDPILKNARKQFWSAKSEDEKTKVLLATQDKLKGITGSHPGDLGLMARSGGRGNLAQMMKATASPVVIGDYHGAPVPYLISRGYSEGLAPAEHWIAGDESRAQVIKGQLGTADPGELGNIMAAMMSSQVISSEDCGTDNGLLLKSGDTNSLGRFEAGTNRIVDSRILKAVGRTGGIKVRSPMTCELPSGVCKKCQGTNNYGELEEIGSNVGVASAQALGEPLTQLTLSSKHGISFVEGDRDIPRGVAAVRQFLETPSSFMAKATLAQNNGTVTHISRAPQGGHDINVSGTSHYVPPSRGIRVSVGDRVSPGDTLTNGVPSPVEVVKYKGLGEGRKYLTDAMHKVYGDSGVNIDKRHLENLVKAQLGYYKVTGSGIGQHLPGEVITSKEVEAAYQVRAKKFPVSGASGKILAKQTLHHLPGTPIDSGMVNQFREAKLPSVYAVEEDPNVEPFVTSASRVPLLNPDWLQRLGHRYQKDTLLQAANYGEKSDIHSHNPVPALIFGTEIRKGPEGKY